MALFKDYKEFFEREFELEYHDIHVVREQINELITALEAAQAEVADIKTRIQPTEEETYHTLHDWEDFWAMERMYLDQDRWVDIWTLLRTVKSTWDNNYELIKDNANLRAQLAEEQSKNGMLETMMSVDKTTLKDAVLLAEGELAEAQAEVELLREDAKDYIEQAEKNLSSAGWKKG